MAVDPTTAATVYVGTGDPNDTNRQGGDGIYKTTNSGAAWAKGSTGLSASNVTAMVQSPSSAATLYAAVLGSGIYETTNSGTSWAATAGQPTDVYPVSIGIAPSNASRIYVGGLGRTLSITSNAGTTWSPSAGATSPWPTFRTANCFIINPTNADEAWAGADYDIYHSTNAGQDWTALNATVSGSGLSQVRALLIDRSTATTFYAAYQGGVAVSTDSGTTWAGAALGLSGNTITALAQGKVTTSDFFAGSSSDNLYHDTTSLVTAPSWSVSLNYNISGVTVAVSGLQFDPTVSNVAYAAANIGVGRTADDGTTWVNAGSGLYNPDVNVLVHDSATTNLLYLGTHGSGAWKTSSGGL
jgi:hypothetical protein